ncbi:permease [Paraburkholderia hayleyella]|uniref:permease n=1 Tax=Paraburkholderia hayleyella TaxID=2152889 RepID=UPI00129136E0|nr:permease [Paraburkholderia hayleyella]
MNTTRRTSSQASFFPGWIIVLLLAVCGLFYVKWLPYYDRALSAAQTHALGVSILMGHETSPPEPSLAAAFDYAFAYGRAIWQAMVLGLLLGSAVQALLPARWIARVLGSTGLGSVVVGGLLALPGMMCTCCAAPVVAGLRQQRASPGGALAFWLGNSVLNPATLVFIGFVLGWRWAALRLVLGGLMVFGLGYWVNGLARLRDRADRKPLAQTQDLALQHGAFDGNPLRRWVHIFMRMARRLLPEYLVLILLLGAARAWLFPHAGPEIGNHVGWIVGMALAGTLFAVPTAGEVPIIQAMLTLGISAGPAAALLLTLPPVSLPSLVMLARSFEPKVLALVTGAVAGFGVIAGSLAWLLGF